MVASSVNRPTALVAACVVALFVTAAGAVAIDASSTGIDRPIQETTPATEQNESETNVSLQNLTAPERVRAGTDYAVSATIVNRGEETASTRASYRIEGNVIATRLVDISGNDTETVRFDVPGNATAGLPTGTFTHGVYTGDDVNVTTNVTLTGSEVETTPETAEETVEETTPEEATAEDTEAVETTPEEAQTPNISFGNQSSDGSTVTVQSVTVPEGGFVVVHDDGVVEGEVVDSILGESSYLEAGTHRNVTIELNESLDRSQRLVAVAYRDSNENRTFDLATSNRTADGPYTRDDGPTAVSDFANVTVETDEES